jgi:hypothetical protein
MAEHCHTKANMKILCSRRNINYITVKCEKRNGTFDFLMVLMYSVCMSHVNPAENYDFITLPYFQEQRQDAGAIGGKHGGQTPLLRAVCTRMK